MPSPEDAASLPVDPHRAPRSGGAPLVFGVAVGALATAAYLAGSLARAPGTVAVPVASITALVLFFGATPLIQRVARWAGSPRPERAAAWSLISAAPLLFLGAKFAIGHDPIVTSHWRCGSGDIGLM